VRVPGTNEKQVSRVWTQASHHVPLVRYGVRRHNPTLNQTQTNKMGDDCRQQLAFKIAAKPLQHSTT